MTHCATPLAVLAAVLLLASPAPARTVVLLEARDASLCLARLSLDALGNDESAWAARMRGEIEGLAGGIRDERSADAARALMVYLVGDVQTVNADRPPSDERTRKAVEARVPVVTAFVGNRPTAGGPIAPCPH